MAALAKVLRYRLPTTTLPVITPWGESSSSGSDNPSTDPNINNPSSIIDCFVYYPGATFTYVITDKNNKQTKMVWTVSSYDTGTQTASINVTYSDDTAPTTIQIRKLSNNALEYLTGSSWYNLTNPTGEVNLLQAGVASKPSGLYGSVISKITPSNISTPNGASSSGYRITSSYDNTSNDSFSYDDENSEEWSSECGLVRSSRFISNMKEYPPYTFRKNVELASYSIPMPDGTVRSYAPASATVYPVQNLTVDYAMLKDYDAAFFGWNDSRNSDVITYNLYNLYEEDGIWYAEKMKTTAGQWKLEAWFEGKEHSGSIVERTHLGELLSIERVSLLPVGMFTFAVTAETTYGESDLEDPNSEFVKVYFSGDPYATSTEYFNLTRADFPATPFVKR